MPDSKGRFAKGEHWRPHQVFRDEQWLIENYVHAKRSAGEIALEFGVTEAAILYWLTKHKIPRRSIAEARSVKHWGLFGSDNPMWNRRGELNPNWKGGVTPERQEFYQSQEWKTVCSATWKRANATCERCKIHRSDALDLPFHIHHIVSFSNKELRAEPTNLVLLCEICHHFVHSKRNVNRDFLPQI